MKQKKGLIGVVLLILVVVSFRLYKKYDRQRILDEKRQKQTEWLLKMKKQRDSLEQVKQDSIQKANYKSPFDSIRKVNEKKLEEMKELMKKLEKQE